MSEEQLKLMRDEIVKAVGITIPPAIERVVNGNIRDIGQKLDIHILEHQADVTEVKQFMQDALPIIETYKGSKMLGEMLKWVAGVAISILAIKTFLQL